MPSSATITSGDLTDFVAGTKIQSSKVDNNFSVWRGHNLPVSTDTSTAATSGTYDLGSTDHYWRGVHSQYGVHYVNTAGSVPATPAANYLHTYSKQNELYQKNSSGVEKQVGGWTFVGSRTSPSTITAAGGIAFDIASGMKQMWFITGDTTVGTDITANPQIAAGTLGAEIMLVVPNTSTSRPVLLDHGNGLDQNGYFGASAGCNIHYFYDGLSWQEKTRRES